jgi:hypothetical protein
VAERSTPTSGQVTPVDEATCELVTGTDSLHAAYLSGFDVPFTVLEAPKLRDLLRELAARYTAATGGNASRGPRTGLRSRHNP